MNQSKIFKYSSRCAVILHSCIIDPDDRKSDYNAQLCKHSFGDAAANKGRITILARGRYVTKRTFLNFAF